MADDAEKVAAAYFGSWRTKEFTTLRGLLADDVEYEGPLARHGNGDAVAGALEGMAGITVDLVVERTFVDDGDVLTWFVLHTTIAEPTPVANLMRVENGKITRLRAIYDPRGLTSA
ncbi:nuclear transport factor 2 family protein [Kitasatospora sp. NPDC050463]|uniref:nuclear transport factor 2 family protein n=1 Tax=Kitasatospora sp. NPDC050463 TaxID=3155786 RepID=UPI0034023FA7